MFLLRNATPVHLVPGKYERSSQSILAHTKNNRPTHWSLLLRASSTARSQNLVNHCFFFMFIKVSTSFEDRFTHPHPKKAKNYKTLPAGLEPATLRLTASRSNQLSYGSMTLHDDWGSAVAHASLCVRVGGEVVILRTIRNGPHCESRAWWQNPDDMNVQMHSDAKTKIALNKRMSTCSASS